MRTFFFRMVLIIPIALVSLTSLIRLLPGCSSRNPDKPHILIRTGAGDIEVGFYKNGSFYRVLNDDNQSSDEQTHILHKDGVLSLARTTPGTAGSEFFICIGDQPGFDYGGENNPDGQGYAAFGKVVRGLDIVRNIYARPENNQSFDPSVPIFSIERQ